MQNEINHPNKVQKKYKKISFTFLLIFCFLIACVTLRNVVYQQKANYITNLTHNNLAWNLTLVNKLNPISNKNKMEFTVLSNGERVDTRIYPSLQKMFSDARKAGVYPKVASGYRSKEEQKKLYTEKIASFKQKGYSNSQAMKATEEWVALPGTSEHQLGLAVDINADGVHSTGNQVYNWLANNSYKYGFIKRYPADKTKITGIMNEPWHYRYVGVQAATEMVQKNLCLEEYLLEAK